MKMLLLAGGICYLLQSAVFSEQNKYCNALQEIARSSDGHTLMIACDKVQGNYQGIFVKSGDKQQFFNWSNSVNKTYAPEIFTDDINHDKAPEIVVVLTKDHGTGLTVREAHILNSKTFGEIPLVDPVTVVKQRVTSSKNKSGVQVIVDGKEQHISTKQIGIDQEKWFDHLYFGNIIRFEIKDHMLISRLPGQISPGGVIGETVIHYEFQENLFVP